MSRVLALRPDPRSEFDEGVDYADAWRPGQGAALTLAVNAELARFAANPRLGMEVLPGVRRKLVPGTKYCVIYLFDDAVLDVVSVFHTSRDPAVWQRRV